MIWGLYTRSVQLVDKDQLDVLLKRYAEYDWTVLRDAASVSFIGTKWVTDRFVSFTIKEITDETQDTAEAPPATWRSRQTTGQDRHQASSSASGGRWFDT